MEQFNEQRKLANQKSQPQQNESNPIMRDNDEQTTSNKLEILAADVLANEPLAEPSTPSEQSDVTLNPDLEQQMSEESEIREYSEEAVLDDAEGESVSNSETVDEDSEELSRVIEELCLSKAEEFAMLGYDSITGKDIWEYVSESYDRTGIPPLHRLINDILSLRVTDYMNWLTLSAYKGLKFTE